MMELEIVNDELPYRIKIDKLEGASNKDFKTAALCALSAGTRIPAGLRDGKEAASYIFWHYEANPDWCNLISLLENGDKVVCKECFQIRPNDDRVKNGMKCADCAGYANS